MSQRGYYSIVQFCPSAARAEAANVGVVLVDAKTGAVHSLLSPTNAHAKWVFGKHHEALPMLDMGKRMLVERLRSSISPEVTQPVLRELMAREGNALALTAPRPLVFEDAEQQVRTLYEELVGDPIEPDRVVEHRVGRSRVIPEVRQLGKSLAKDQVPVQLKPHLHIPDLDRDLSGDFMYRNGAMNVVRGQVFWSHQFEKTCADLVTKGLILAERPIEQRQHRLVLVCEFEEPALAHRAAGIFQPAHVELIPKSDLATFEKRVRAEAKPFD